MEQSTLTEHVQLSRQACSALLDLRFRGPVADATIYPRHVVRELDAAGVVIEYAGWLDGDTRVELTDRGRTCGIRNRELA
jgi:hypothetical protein